MDPTIEAEEKEAMDFLSPLLPLFYEGWGISQSTYRGYPAAALADHDDATAHACVRSHMMAYVINQIDGRPGVHLLNARGLKLLNYFDRYVIRFKHVDGRGLHRNYPTEQQEDFDKDFDIPGLPQEAVRLTSGYQLDAAGESIERVVMSRVLGKNVLWQAQINVIAAEAQWVDITPDRFAGTGRVQAVFKKNGRLQ